MKKLILTGLLTLLCITATSAQTKEADPKDVATLDGIMKAVYDVISGDAGKARDWDRFRSLFDKNARLIPTRKKADSDLATTLSITPEEYVTRASAILEKEGFFESEISRKVEQFGHIAHVFSTYQSKHKAADAKPFARGINSFQLFFDGKRWWVMTIYWDEETKENPLPKKYLK